jgi:hypothetical protein
MIADIRERQHTVPFMAKTKFSRNRLKYRGPNDSVNMNTNAPTKTMGIG